jgi:hypothetical protein
MTKMSKVRSSQTCWPRPVGLVPGELPGRDRLQVSVIARPPKWGYPAYLALSTSAELLVMPRISLRNRQENGSGLATILHKASCEMVMGLEHEGQKERGGFFQI